MSKLSIVELLAAKPVRVGGTKIIAIDGHGGSGKSTLAKLLADKLNAEIIQTDDFASWENPLNWYPLLIERVFKPIENGTRSLSYPRSKWWENHNPEPVVDQPVRPIMILEGISSLRKEFRDYLSLSIFVDTQYDICLKRGIDRDLQNDTGKTESEIRNLWDKWYKDEEEYLTSDLPKTYADIVIDGTKPFDEQIAELQ